ncbi:TIGR03086 family metal-binding protein [Rhodococcoides yunnanense]|uniref:TIGR03086 family metal-binding protein n=1 Tax=Rhodococcoides yunnanense TaxID=278209 RepID=UPI000935045A|nr:TIGR03086 family metal-binding protein [Rhodococcus yunnanensis]
MTATTLDPRPLYRDALAWVTDLIAGVTQDQMGLPTPCPDFDVRTLLGHQLAGVRRARTMGLGGDARTVPFVLTDFGDPVTAYRAEADLALGVWDDDDKLTTTVTAPWGTVPGRAAVWAYINETLVHGWDLAVSTGQPFEADPDLVSPVLVAATRAIPGDSRDEMPFGEVVAPGAQAGPTERLANWSGRVSTPWTSAASHGRAGSR